MERRGQMTRLKLAKPTPLEHEVPIEQLVVEAYESAPPTTRTRILSQLVGRVYESSPAFVRRSLLVQLLQPMGVLSLVSIANGIFAKIRFRSGWSEVAVNLDDIQEVQASDVVALASHVQQLSTDAINGLAQIIASAPMLTGSGAVFVLLNLLHNHSKYRRAGDNEFQNQYLQG